MATSRTSKQPTPMCPACGGPADRAKPKGSVGCRVCGGAMEDSPLGKQALTAAAQQGAQKVKAAVQQRQQAQQRPGMPMGRPGMGQPMPQRPGMTQGQGQPQGRIDPRAVALLQALAQRGGGR
jgi:uncharacterized Zn finger protein (UPF0148 family)